jgi:hypothetical protein
MIFWQIIPVQYGQKKTKKNSKKRLLGPISRSKLCEYGPEIVEKKYTVAHSIPDVTPRKNKKVRSVRGYYMRGLPVFPSTFYMIKNVEKSSFYFLVILILRDI